MWPDYGSSGGWAWGCLGRAVREGERSWGGSENLQTAAREKGLCLHRLSQQRIASTLKSPIFNKTDLLFKDGEVRWAAA